MLKILLVLVTFFVVAVFRPVEVHAIGMAKITVRVVDGEGKSVEAAQVRIRFQAAAFDIVIANQLALKGATLKMRGARERQ